MELSNALVDALFSQCRVGVGVCDGDGRLQEFNAALESMVGPVLRESAQQEEVPLARALAGEVVTDVAITTRRPGEPVRHLRCTAAPLVDGGQTAGALVLVTETERDVDPAASVDAELAHYWQRLSRLQELSSRVAIIANHQIRTPLTVIQAHLELLEDAGDDLPESARRALPALRRGVASLTDALTALTRANDLANAADPTVESVDLVDVARRATTMVRAGHPMLRIHLADESTPGVPAYADALWVRRAIVALSDALVGADHDAYVTLDVIDDGDTVGVRVCRLGRDPSHPAGLTEGWASHGDASTDPRCLGLALAEAVALAHDGRVEIAETPTGLSATLLLSRVPRPPSRHESTAAPHLVP
jgi:signal transduction histidine kinase